MYVEPVDADVQVATKYERNNWGRENPEIDKHRSIVHDQNTT